MPFQPVPDTAQVTYRYVNDLFDKEFINQIYFRRSGGWSQAQIQQLADEARLRFITGNLEPHMPLNARLQPPEARDLSTEFGAQATAAGGEVMGTGIVPFSSPNNAAMVRFLAATGPPRRGGIYWPYVSEDAISAAGEISTTTRTDLETEWRGLCEGLEVALGITHVIVSRYQRATPPATGSVLRSPNALTAEVTNYQTLRRVASQRDRRADLPGF